MMKLRLGVVLVTMILATACGSGGSDQPPAGASLDVEPSITSQPPPAIEGAWRSDYTCQDFVQAYEDAGVGKFASASLVGLHMLEPSAEGSPDPCKEAVDIQLTHVFRPNGYILDYQGTKLVGDYHGYALIGDDTFVVLGDSGDPDISLHYVIDGDTLTFDVALPDPCSANCQDQVAYAVGQYAVGPWERES
jgi:hypothetical protein